MSASLLSGQVFKESSCEKPTYRGAPILREIFLKYDNAIHGKYLADLTKEVFHDLRQTEYQSAEYRISIYGRSSSEWDSLAGWIVGYSLQSENVAWMVQIPRLFNVYKEQKLLSNFQAMLDNIFQPLFEVRIELVHISIYIVSRQQWRNEYVCR